MNKFSKTDWETLIYIHNNAEVGSELWRESGYEQSARQQSIHWERNHSASSLADLLKGNKA